MKLMPPVPNASVPGRRANGPGTTTGRTVPHLVPDQFRQKPSEFSRIGELPIQVPSTEPRRLPRVLLVNADRTALTRLEARLTSSGYRVLAVSSFQYAKHSLNVDPPDLLVADVRLEAFNGLHLAARSRIDNPGLPVIITNISPDTVLESQARDLGAIYIVNPLENPEFLQYVRAAFDESRRARVYYR